MNIAIIVTPDTGIAAGEAWGIEGTFGFGTRSSPGLHTRLEIGVAGKAEGLTTGFGHFRVGFAMLGL
jgi:hypothetical protein